MIPELCSLREKESSGDLVIHVKGQGGKVFKQYHLKKF